MTDATAMGGTPTGRRRLPMIIGTAVGTVVLVSVALTLIGVTRAESRETQRLCAVALDTAAAAAAAVQETLLEADGTLAILDRAGVHRTEGPPTGAFAGSPAPVPTGAGTAGAMRLRSLTAALEGISIPTDCADRDQAAEITDLAERALAAHVELDAALTALHAELARQADLTRVAAE